jgi:hypothetical protein
MARFERVSPWQLASVAMFEGIGPRHADAAEFNCNLFERSGQIVEQRAEKGDEAPRLITKTEREIYSPGAGPTSGLAMTRWSRSPSLLAQSDD